VVADIDEPGAMETIRRIRSARGRAQFVRSDLGRAADVRRMVGFAVETYGGLDVLINNAGFAIDPSFPRAEYEAWRRLLDVNLVGLMHATQLAIEAMRGRGDGVIVNVSSVAGLGLMPYDSPDYAASKAAIVRLTACLAWLREKDGIRVNAICPDWVATEAVVARRASMSEQEWRARGAPKVLVPLEAVADAVITLIEDESLAGRVMNCPCGEPWGLLPQE
jgi:NAD(P)-dependent dehydrogenase (short-subunit alcohol dehydrogenase family)